MKISVAYDFHSAIFEVQTNDVQQTALRTHLAEKLKVFKKTFDLSL